MVLSRLTHECEIVLEIILLTRLPRDVKPLSRLLYCGNSHTIWNRCADYCTITTYTQCETVGHIIVLSRLAHNVKQQYNILQCCHCQFLKALDPDMQMFTELLISYVYMVRVMVFNTTFTSIPLTNFFYHTIHLTMSRNRIHNVFFIIETD